MEYASEMVVKATLARLVSRKCRRRFRRTAASRPPHLRSWRDGWRHLRFLLIMSPRWLLFYPGLGLMAVGLAFQAVIASGPVVINGVGLDIHTMLYAAGLTILGLQLVVFSLLARAIGCLKGVLPMTPWFSRFLAGFSLERGIGTGMLIGTVGLVSGAYSVAAWAATGLSAVDPTSMMRVAIPSVTLMIAGAEIVFASFVLSFIDVPATPTLAEPST